MASFSVLELAERIKKNFLRGRQLFISLYIGKAGLMSFLSPDESREETSTPNEAPLGPDAKAWQDLQVRREQVQ